MTDFRVPKYALVQCQVLDHQPYGLLIQAGAGSRGFVDRADIADGVVAPEDWPRVGESMTCVVLGYARDGRVRASSRPRDVALVRDSREPGGAISAWIRVRDHGFSDPSDKEVFFASPDAVPTLRWALRHRVGSLDQNRALEVLADAPEEIVREVGEPGD
jgi:hypothetical protein